MQDLLRVGVITSTHGIKGEVKVFPTTDDSKRFKTLKKCLVQLKRETVHLEIESVKFFKQFVILKFKDHNKIEDVEKYLKQDLWIDRKDAVKCLPGEFFICDLIGLDVISDDGNTIGKLTDVLQTGANDVYEVTDNSGQQILIPAIKDCILKIDLENSQITVHLLKGLMDINKK